MRIMAFILCAGFFVFAPLQSFAEEKKEPPKNDVLAAAEEFTKDLDERSKRHFTVLYGNYNLIKVVEDVRDSVDTAIDACGEANPDMKEDLDTRFKEWKAAIKPVLKEADGNVDNMVVAQDYAKPREIKKFFKLIDKARKQQGKEVEKIPVTSLEACESLLKRMDGTQANMVRLLQSTLVSLPRVIQAEDEKAKAEEEAKAKAEAEKAAQEAEEEAKKAAEKSEPQDL